MTAYEKEVALREKQKQETDAQRQIDKTKALEDKLEEQQKQTEELERELNRIERDRALNRAKQEKLDKENERKAKKLAKEVAKASKTAKKQKVNSSLTKKGQENSGSENNERKIKKSKKTNEKDQGQKSGPIRIEQETSSQKEFPEEGLNASDIDKLRAELKLNEEKALQFIFPSIETEEDKISRENFFSQTEKEQLLELWRSTLARNRTVQFIVKSLSANPDELEKNNAVMQVLSKALFVPFYAASAITSNALVSGGSAVGARVIGDVVDSTNAKADRTKQITKTDMIVLFMLVDEVAERMRQSYYTYKEAKIEKELLLYELEPARIDASEALDMKDKSSVFFTRMVVRDLERRSREVELRYLSSRRTLVELAGEQSVDSVDLLINLEVEEMLSDIVGV